MRAKFLVSAVMGISISVYAADPDYNSHRSEGAVKGYDVVAYFSLPPGAKAVKGEKKYGYLWKDTAWYFSSEENLQKFKDNPEAYAPQYGGYCAFAVGKNFTTSIRPDSWTIHDDKLYLNHNQASLKIFNNELEKSIELA